MSSDGDAPDERVLLEAESTEAYLERRRFQDLLDARDAVVKRLRDRPAARYSRDAPPVQHLDDDLHAATKAYIVEAKWLFDASAKGRRLWSERQLGPVPVEAALNVGELDDIDESTLPPQIEYRNGVFALDGVRAYVRLSETDVRVTHTKTLDRRASPTRRDEERVRFTPPRRLSEAAFGATDELLAEMGVLGELGADDWESDEPGA
jgi:hypothetical protein